MYAGTFTPPTLWPVADLDGDEQEAIVVSAVQGGDWDEDGDMLFGIEALSQAHWATASTFSPNDLFHGPIKLVIEKRGRERRRIEKQRRHGELVSRKGIWQGLWEFDMFS